MDLRKCVLSCLNSLEALRVRKLCDLTEVEYCPTGYKKGNTPPAEGWMPYHPDIPLKGMDGHYWLRASFTTPAVEEGEELLLKITTGYEGQADTLNPQGLLYLNGKMVQGLDTNHSEAYVEPETEYELYNYFYVGMIDGSTSYRMQLMARDKQVDQLYYDLKVPYDVCVTMKPDEENYIRMLSVMTDAVRLVDLRAPGSDAFRRSLNEAIAFMREEFYGKVCSTQGKPVVHCVGHTHIDVEWKWHRAQTREKMQRSFATAKSLMDRYPEYKFMLSQPELYRYLKEEAPEKYEELKELVSQGRWEPEGSMYLEADCNLTSGESLVRQILHGKKFFKDEFGVDNKVLFLPDVFGYSAAMPQILKKSGVDYFVTSKISWNDTNMMPRDAFYWEGIDGTEIFTSFITTQEMGGHFSKRTLGKNKNNTTYVGHLTPTEIRGTWDRFQQKEYTPHTMTTYGFGDGGGGPTREMLETQRRLAYGLPGMPVTKMSFLLPYLETTKAAFDKTCARTDRTPRWVGELYLEYHRGTYTSVAKVKKGNRLSEFRLANAEALSATDLYFGGSYDQDGLNRFWRKTLHNQFHDILPGSSIGEVYDGTDLDYEQILSYAQSVADEKLHAIAARLNTAGGTLVYNPTGFARKASLPMNGAYCETEESVPPFGWTVLKNPAPKCRVKLSGSTAENDLYVLTLNGAGQIASLVDKRTGRDVFKSGRAGNALEIFEDNPTNYDNWELEDYYKLKKYTLNEPATVTPVTDGTRAGFRIERPYLSSTIIQNLWLYSDSPRIDFETTLDWHEHHQVLKARFPLDVHAMSATFDVQFGHVTRSTHENTSWDAAKFEVYGHKWVDVSESGYGAALLSDSKYGFNTEGSELSITLLKCGTFPDPNADQGKHTFTYSLMPHVGDFRAAGVIEESWVLNQPLLSCPVAAGKGDLAETFSLVSVDRPNAVITAVKKAEADQGLIVRLFDAHDCTSTVTVTVPAGYTKAELCDLLETPERELTVADGKVTLPLSNFEIVTLKFTR
ncbi:MAG: alpha-mannosidase [Clostridia bacterium]|nr:alpha-mannosidase [Clostridia bacterium]